jgi:hypothetical protein
MIECDSRSRFEFYNEGQIAIVRVYEKREKGDNNFYAAIVAQGMGEKTIVMSWIREDWRGITRQAVDNFYGVIEGYLSCPM